MRPDVTKPRSARSRQAGVSFIELMISMAVMAVGTGGVLLMITSSIATNGRNKLDSTGTMVAQMVLEQIMAQPANSTSNITIADCNAAGAQTWTIATTGATSPGAGADVNTSTGVIDYSQAYSSVPANYAMRYVACGNGGQGVTYDVRWNVQTATASTRMVTVSARQLGSGSGGLNFAPAITLRSIGGM